MSARAGPSTFPTSYTAPAPGTPSPAPMRPPSTYMPSTYMPSNPSTRPTSLTETVVEVQELHNVPLTAAHGREFHPRFEPATLGSIPTHTFGPASAYAFNDPNAMRHLTGPRPKRASRLARRIHGWTWQAFPIGMGTSAVYVTMSGLRDRSNTLKTVETVFYFLNMALFLLNCTTLLLQAILYPRQARRLVTDPSKNIFVPLVLLSFATLIIGTINYAIPSGHVGPGFIYALFWLYVSLAIAVSFPLLMIWFNQPHDLKTFTPAWAFLIFPMMLVGVVAFNVLKTIDPADQRALGVLFVGYFFQGIGFFVTMFYLCIYFIRIMTTGFMDGHQANGAFVACGPPGFTALALINLGDRAREILPNFDIISPMAGEIWYATGVISGILLFGLAVFLFVFGVLPYWFKLHKHLNEILGCWALTFPNVGWISTVGVLGNTLKIPGFFEVHIILVIVMAAVWLVLFAFTAIAFWRGLIFYAQDEDVLNDERRAWTEKEKEFV